MIDITLENFETDLMAASVQTPVLLDIWAPWCGPCKQLGPVLEKLEAEYEGRFILAKLNADEEPQIAGQLSQMFGVRSIPFCVMFGGGQPVDGFVGAIPEADIRAFLDKHTIPSDTLASAEETAEAEALMADGEPAHADEALGKLLDALEKDPANDEARFDLIKLLLSRGDVDGAQSVFAAVAPRASGPLPDKRVQAFGMYVDAAAMVRTARSPAELEAAIAANKRDFDARFEWAQALFGVGRFTDAMDALLEIIMRDKTWADEKARKTYVGILEVMTKPVVRAPAKPAGAPAGPGAANQPPKLEVAGKVEVTPADPVIDQYRRKLSMAIF